MTFNWTEPTAPLDSANLTGDPTAPTAPVDDSDTSIANTGWVQGEINQVMPFAYFSDYNSRLSGDTLAGEMNQTTTLNSYLSLVSNLPEAGDYKFTISYEWSVNDTGNDFVGQVTLDAAVILNHLQEPKDSGGGGVTLRTTTDTSVNSGTNQRMVASFSHVETGMSAGSTTLDFSFAGGGSNIEASVYRATLIVERVR